MNLLTGARRAKQDLLTRMWKMAYAKDVLLNRTKTNVSVDAKNYKIR